MQNGLALKNKRDGDLRKESIAGGSAMRVALFLCVGVALSACGSATNTAKSPHVNHKTKFTSKEFGVTASKRVTTAKRVKKGGGSFKIGKPYKVRGKWYHPKEEPNYDKKGYASWYGPNFHGRKTANGEIYDQYHLSGAHPTFPLPSYARVTNLKNGHSVIIRVNDRGPYAHGRIIDVSSKAADLLDFKREGTAKVRVQYVGKARMDGRDMPYLTASYQRNGKRSPVEPSGGGIASGVMLALNAPKKAVTSVFGGGTQVASLEPMNRRPTGNVTEQPSGRAVKGGRVTVISGGSTLPDIGPIPQQRPSFVNNLATGPAQSPTELASYVQQRIEQRAASPFAKILSRPKRLTETMIAASWKKRDK